MSTPAFVSIHINFDEKTGKLVLTGTPNPERGTPLRDDDTDASPEVLYYLDRSGDKPKYVKCNRISVDTLCDAIADMSNISGHELFLKLFSNRSRWNIYELLAAFLIWMEFPRKEFTISDEELTERFKRQGAKFPDEYEGVLYELEHYNDCFFDSMVDYTGTVWFYRREGDVAIPVLPDAFSDGSVFCLFYHDLIEQRDGNGRFVISDRKFRRLCCNRYFLRAYQTATAGDGYYEDERLSAMIDIFSELAREKYL